MRCVSGPVKHCWLYYNAETRTHHADQAGPVLICVCMFNIYNPPSLVQSHAGSNMHARRHTCTPDPFLSARSDGRLPAKKRKKEEGAVFGVKTHLQGLVGDSHTHMDEHTHPPSHCLFRLEGFNSRVQLQSSGHRPHTSFSGVLALWL